MLQVNIYVHMSAKTWSSPGLAGLVQVKVLYHHHKLHIHHGRQRSPSVISYAPVTKNPPDSRLHEVWSPHVVL